MPLYQFQDLEKNILKTILFIHIPKNAGTSIEDFFERLGCKHFLTPKEYINFKNFLKIQPTHFDYHLLDQIIKLEKLYNFVVVRNPINRLISTFKWMKYSSNAKNIFNKMELDDFVDYAFSNNQNEKFNNFIQPQHKFIIPKITKIFKIEQGLDKILKTVLYDNKISLNKEIKIKFLKKSPDEEIKAKDTTIVKIKNFYKKDFEYFNY